ncbi:GNAT family N-acetyltransferase [Proteus hauseri]|uniref:GNAT family N-acetyltransferase n=1 Tax=Proteus hauseri TaxID=183417 RepID=UPI001FC9F55F|nr:GNAT family N-acetyltransferase [Proteus hauseri]
MSTVENKLEMLFISTDARGHGCGKFLLNFAVEKLNIDKLDVNEQNSQAIGFYNHLGFNEIGCSAVDGQSNPYPLLHLKLNKSKYKY